VKRIVYIQYTNPAAYPPLTHSSAILAERGWEVLFLGITALGAAAFTLPVHRGIRARRLGGTSGGSLSSIKYATFAVRALAAAKQFRADWCYASDAFSAPIALALKTLSRVRVLYHEHDVPALPTGPRHDAILVARDRLARSADIVVAPAAPRLALIPAGSTARFVVWNCPRKSEIVPEPARVDDGKFRVVYAGSLSRDRLTPQFIDALTLLPGLVELHVFAYETQGHQGYRNELADRARSVGVAGRFFQHDVITTRSKLLSRLSNCDVGIATVTPQTSDKNLQTLAGASNKAFEYLSAGIPLLVNSEREWQELFVEPGYAASCEPTDAPSIAAAIRILFDNRERARTMGAAGQQRIREDWNYEAQFEPVVKALEQ
jgi:glycosyltransferase involved in cell wall biosynthesis